MADKFVYRSNKVVEVNAKITLTDDAGKAKEVEPAFGVRLDFSDMAEADLYCNAARTVWITLQGFIRKHWEQRGEVKDKKVTMTELSEFYQKYSSGGGGFGLTGTARALVATGKYTAEQAKEICKDEARKAKAEAWLKSLEVPAF